MSLYELVERERKGLARLTTTMVVTLMLAIIALVLALGTVWLGGARWLELPRALPFVLWLGVVGVLVWGVTRGRRLVQRETTVGGVASAVERERKLRAGALRGVLEVASSGTLGRLGAEQVAELLRAQGGIVLAPQARRRALRRSMAGAGVALAGVLGLVTGAAAAPDGMAALLHPVRAWTGDLLDGVSLEPVPIAVLRGERLTITIRAPGRRQVTLAQRATGGSWRQSNHRVTNGVAAVRLDPIDADLALVATDGRAASDTAVVRVAERPFIGDVTIKAVFPAYLDRREETLPLGETVRVPRGTLLQFAGQSSTDLSSVALVRDAHSVSLDVAGRRFAGSMVASASGRYQWRAVGAAGPVGDVPPALELDVLADSAPHVEILAPGRDTMITAADTVRLSVLATDDHGLAGVTYRAWVVTGRGETRLPMSRAMSGAAGAQWSGESALSMAGMTPGDAMHVVAIATDASPWRQSTESREVILRYPTLTQQRDAVRAAADSTVAKAAATANAQRQLQQRTATAARSRQMEQKGQNPMSYQSAEQAKQFAKEQRELADRMQQVQQAARQLEEQLKQAGALDSALQERLREAQKLLREALTPELQEKLRQLEQASNKLSQEDARRALQDLAEQQRRLREQLEKSVEMLKRAALEGQMETLKDEAKEMAKRQRELVDSLRKADTEREISEAEKAARQMAEQAKDLAKDVKDLQQRLRNEQAESGAEKTAEASQKMQESVRQMERTARETAGAKQQETEQRQGQQQPGEQKAQGQKAQGQQQAQGNQQQQGQGNQQGQQKSQQGQQGQQAAGNAKAEGAQQSAEEAARAMEQAAEDLAKAREQQVSEWKQELTGELDRNIQEMLQLAREQDQLEQRARSGAATDELRSQQSALQQGVEKAQQRLQDASRKSQLLSQRSLRMANDARRKVEDATRQTQQAQSGQQMAGTMREASEALNQVAASLVRDRERAQNSNSATGFAEMLQQLQQMAQQQNALNQAAQDLLPRPGQSLDQQGQAQSRQLAKEQREVAAQLEDAADRDETGKAEQMAREARQIAQALEMAQLDPAVLERQQRLFRKMLDAGKLLEEDQREDTGKREAKAWTGSEVFTPPNATAAGKAATRFQPPTWNELRGLTPEERRLVLEYFRKINAERP